MHFYGGLEKQGVTKIIKYTDEEIMNNYRNKQMMWDGDKPYFMEYSLPPWTWKAGGLQFCPCSS